MSATALTPAENEAYLSQLNTSGALDDPSFQRSYGVGKTYADVDAYLAAWKTAHGVTGATLSSAQKKLLGLTDFAVAETPENLAALKALPPVYPTMGAPQIWTSAPEVAPRVPDNSGNVTILGNLSGGSPSLGSVLTYGPGGALDTGDTSGPTGLRTTTAAVAAAGGLSPMLLLALAALAAYFLFLRK